MATIVTIEWNGDKPPTTWYNRLTSIGIRMSKKFVTFKEGGKTLQEIADEYETTVFEILKTNKIDNESMVKDKQRLEIPIESRRKFKTQNRYDVQRYSYGWSYDRRVNLGNEVSGIVDQEGTLICSSVEFAIAMKKLAEFYGAVRVEIYDAHPCTAYDENVANTYLARIENMYGKVGRRTADEKQRWNVTCLDELITTSVDDEIGVVLCPSCKSPRITARPGNTYAIDLKTDDKFLYWVTSRFLASLGKFEIPFAYEQDEDKRVHGVTYVEPKTLPTADGVVGMISNGSKEVAEAIMKNTKIHAQIAKIVSKTETPVGENIDRNLFENIIAANLYDAIWSGKMASQSRRAGARSETIIMLTSRGYDVLSPGDNRISIFESAEPELIDMACIKGSNETARLIALTIRD